MKNYQLLTLVLLFVFHQHKSYCQYSLPNSETLVKNNISVIHVTKATKRNQNALKNGISKKSFNSTPRLLTSYFISHTGRIDSVYQYFTDTTKYNKHIFRFGTDNELEEIKVINPSGEVIKRTLLEKTIKNEFHLRNWSQSVVIYDLKITADSIIYEITSYGSFNPVVYYTKTLYDLDKETKSKFEYKGNELVIKETYQWLSNNGVPYQFNYLKYSSGEGKEKSKTETKEYEVASDGSIMSENKGLFTDPFATTNYFNWQVRFKGMQHSFAHLLRLNTMVSQQEASEIIDFEGTEVIHTYSITYQQYP